MNKEWSAVNAAWKRLKKNKAAMAGLLVIVSLFFISLLAYVIAPDHSSNANRMIVEIGGRSPGFTQSFLLVKNPSYKKASWFSELFFGTKDPYNYIPINSYRKQADSIEVMQYIDEGIAEKRTYSLKDLADQPVTEKTFWLGTDKFGRDMLSRLLVGTRVSLAVGLIAVLISLTLGVIIGSIAGYFSGWVDDVLMWLINVIWSIPTLLLVFAITLAMGKGFWQVFIAVGLTMWVSVARLIRGQVMSIKEMEYIEAGRALGFSNSRIIIKHILPNVIGPVLVIAASNFATAIVIESGLSFLGVGVQAPQPSWGLMIKENFNFIITHNPMLALAPGLAIMIVVLSFNLLGNGLRDALDVKAKI
jgi:peptide/nickel transport system permease protein